MKYLIKTLNYLVIISFFLNHVKNFTHIELKKSTAKYHSEYLKKLKFKQQNSLSSFLEEKDISLHQQVLAQKRLATYYGELNVGYGRNGDPNKSQNFKMLFDTGSCEFWMPSDECFSERCLTHNRYSKSDTFKPYKNAKMGIQYLSGKVEGQMVLETIGLGDLIVPDQVVGLANEVEIPLLDEVIWDGILGLAYPNKNLKKKGISPIFDNIINQNLLHKRGEKNQFAYYLGLDRGAITFGGADMRFKKNMDEEFKWAPIAEKNYWTITLLDIRKYPNGHTKPDDNDMDGNVLCPQGCKSIVDTGTYLIYGPSDQLNSFLADMNLNSCEDKYNLPNLGLIFKGYSINGKDSAFELLLTPDDYVLEFEVDGKNDCVIGIGSDNEDSGWTLGQVFLKAYYTVFDRETEAIGFVKSNPDLGKLNEEDINNIQKINELKLNKKTAQSVINTNISVSDYNNQNNMVNGDVTMTLNGFQRAPLESQDNMNKFKNKPNNYFESSFASTTLNKNNYYSFLSEAS